jgi:hypothetical protein
MTMYIPLRVILHFLGEICVATFGNVLPQALVSGAQLLLREDKAENPETMYICPLSELPLHEEKKSSVLFVCIQDTETGEVSAPPNTSLLLCRHITLSNLCYSIQNIFYSLDRWNMVMTRCIVEKNLQLLLESSLEIIGNSIMICDSNFALIAHAVNEVNDDENLSGLISTRTFNPEAISAFVQPQELPALKEQQKIEIRTSLRYSKYEIATFTVMADENYFLIINMFFDRMGNDPGLLDLFSMLLEKIREYVKCVPGIVCEYKEKYSAFLLDMLSKKLPDPAVIRMRARLCGIDPQSPVSVYRIVFSPQHEKAHMNFLLEKLMAAWPAARILPRERDIVIVSDQTKKELMRRGIYEMLIPLLKEYKAVCGFSTTFHGVVHLGAAYKQAELAIKYGLQIRENRSCLNYGLVSQDEFGSADLFSYETYYIYYMYDNAFHANRVLFGNTECAQLLYKVWLSDQYDNSNNLQLMHAYLTSGLRASETAKNMYMHRNNVLYRIERLKEKFGFDFDDPEQCFKLLLAYRLLDYYGDLFFKNNKSDVSLSKFTANAATSA